MKHVVEPIRNKNELREVENYLQENSLRNRLIFVLGINTGLHVSDILGLNIDDVNGKKFVEIREKKTCKYKRFPLNHKLQTLIKEYLITRKKRYSNEDDCPLFIGKNINASSKPRCLLPFIFTNSFRYHFYYT